MPDETAVEGVPYLGSGDPVNSSTKSTRDKARRNQFRLDEGVQRRHLDVVGRALHLVAVVLMQEKADVVLGEVAEPRLSQYMSDVWNVVVRCESMRSTGKRGE